MAFTPVQPVPAQAPTVGLVASAITPNDGARWEDGISWISERCPELEGFDPCGTTFGASAGDDSGDLVNYYRPVAMIVRDTCSTRTRDYDRDRVRRQAEAATSWFAARELEQGTVSRLNPYVTRDTDGDAEAVNAYLASADAIQVAGGPFTPLAGLGALEEAARDAQLGMDPWLHITPRLLPLLTDGISREGRTLRTKTGAHVVVDAGYTGAGPLSGGTAEVQTVTVNGGPTGGTFTLAFNGEVTAPVAYNATANAVQNALNALPNLNGVTVTGVAGGPWTVTFPVDRGNVAQLVADGSGLTGGTAPAVVVATTTPGVAPTVEAGDWIYATGPVTVRLSDIQVHELVVHRDNTLEAQATRLVAAYFDPCTLRAANIAVPAPA